MDLEQIIEYSINCGIKIEQARNSAKNGIDDFPNYLRQAMVLANILNVDLTEEKNYILRVGAYNSIQPLLNEADKLAREGSYAYIVPLGKAQVFAEIAEYEYDIKKNSKKIEDKYKLNKED